MELPSLKNFLGSSKPPGADDNASTAESSQSKSESPSGGVRLGEKITSTDPFSPVDSDVKTVASVSISTDVSRVAGMGRRRRHSAGHGSSYVHRLQQQAATPTVAKMPVFSRAQTELLSADNKKAVWVQRRLRALGRDEEGSVNELKASSPSRCA
jgi:hypothetical protein